MDDFARKEKMRAYARAQYAANPEASRRRSEKWRLKNAEQDKGRRRERARRRYAENRELYRARSVAYRLVHRERRITESAAYRATHPEVKAALQAKRRAARRNACPAWANRFFIAEAYDLARMRTRLTGIKWEVDHIVPLLSPLVCGLHVEANLRVITASANRSKKNVRWEGMP